MELPIATHCSKESKAFQYQRRTNTNLRSTSKIFIKLKMSACGVRRDKAALSSGCKSHPANAPAGSNRSSYGGDEVAEAFG
jgi:hypothetical protein